MEGLYACLFGQSLLRDGNDNDTGVRANASQACFGGMLFGMDSGIIGGVLVMPGFKK